MLELSVRESQYIVEEEQIYTTHSLKKYLSVRILEGSFIE